MKNLISILIILISITAYGVANDDDYLIRVCEDENCELGTPSGYVNINGDTIIPIDQYYYCFTDTLKDFAIVLDKNRICKAVDKSGNTLYEVKWYDNGPDYISEGLFRIIVEGKIGYANKTGEIIIKPQFACTNPFKNGMARVALDCELINEGEHQIMKSENWFYIN